MHIPLEQLLVSSCLKDYKYFTGRDDSDPEINHAFLPVLKNQCPENGNVSDRISSTKSVVINLTIKVYSISRMGRPN